MSRRGVAKKPAGALATSTPELQRCLTACSKAALIDIVCDLLALIAGHADDPVTLEYLKSNIEPVLIARGDRLPA